MSTATVAMPKGNYRGRNNASTLKAPNKSQTNLSKTNIPRSSLSFKKLTRPLIEATRIAGKVVDTIESGADYLKKVPYIGNVAVNLTKGITHTASFGLFAWASAARAKIESTRAKDGINSLTKNIKEFSKLEGTIKERAENLTKKIVKNYSYPKDKVPLLSKKIETIFAKVADKTLGENEFALELENLKEEVVQGYNVKAKTIRATMYTTMGVVATGVGLYVNHLINSFTEAANQVVAPGIDIVTQTVPDGIGPATAQVLENVTDTVQAAGNVVAPAIDTTVNASAGMGSAVVEAATEATSLVPDVTPVLPTLW